MSKVQKKPLQLLMQSCGLIKRVIRIAAEEGSYNLLFPSGSKICQNLAVFTRCEKVTSLLQGYNPNTIINFLGNRMSSMCISRMLLQDHVNTLQGRMILEKKYEPRTGLGRINCLPYNKRLLNQILPKILHKHL